LKQQQHSKESNNFNKRGKKESCFFPSLGGLQHMLGRYSDSIKKTGVILSFLLPAIIIYGIFMVYPILQAVRLSFFDWNGSSQSMNFIWFDNYTKLFQDTIFYRALINNIIWVVMELVIVVVPVLILAILISSVKRGKTFFRAGFYLPAILSMPVVAVIWAKIYDPYIGPINSVLKMIGADGLARNWLVDPITVLPSLILASTWVAYGFYMVLYLAGLQGIDYSLYEAADMDGAGFFAKLFNVTIPSLKPMMNVIITLSVITSFKSFAIVWIATQGGPLYRSEVVATYVYKMAFSQFQASYGAASGVILAVIIISFTVIFNRLREREG